MSSERLVEAGVDPNGDFIISGEQQNLYLQLSTTPQVTQQELLSYIVEGLLPDATTTSLGNNTFAVEGQHGSWVAQFDAENLVLKPWKMNNESPKIPDFALPMPNGGGCQIALDGVNIPYLGSYFSGLPAVLQYGFEDKSIHFTFSNLDNKIDFFQTDGVVSGSGIPLTETPMIHVMLGEKPISLLKDKFLPIPFEVDSQQLKKVESKLRIPTGTSIALFQDGGFSVHLPVNNRCGKKMAGWKLWWGTKRSLKNISYDKVGKRHIRFQSSVGPTDLAIRKGKVIVASPPARIQPLLEKQTSVEENSSFVTFAQNWPFVLQFYVPKELMMFIGPLQRIDIGLRSTSSTWLMEMVPIAKGKTNPVKMLLFFLSTIQPSALPKKSVSIDKEVLSNLLAIGAHQRYLFSTSGKYMFWQQNSPPADGIGHLSEADLLDKYWVEKDASGFVVYGQNEAGEVWGKRLGEPVYPKE